MAARCFYSFHYANDAWRVSQIRNIRLEDGNRPASDNDWEAIKRGGDAAIARWIDSQMEGKSTVIVMIGAETFGRRWVNYEILNGWNRGKALLGVRIHRLLDHNGYQSYRGNNPFAQFNVKGVSMDRFVPVIDPGEVDSKAAYNAIAVNLAGYIDYAKQVRASV
jgi:phosphatidylserine/phosphatidylglycerophosphate/cardiolipin synthase-like enzyme